MPRCTLTTLHPLHPACRRHQARWKAACRSHQNLKEFCSCTRALTMSHERMSRRTTHGCMVERACPRPHSRGHGCSHTQCSHCSSKTRAQQAALHSSVHKLHKADGTCETRVPAVSDCLELFEPGLNGSTHREGVRCRRDLMRAHGHRGVRRLVRSALFEL